MSMDDYNELPTDNERNEGLSALGYELDLSGYNNRY